MPLRLKHGLTCQIAGRRDFLASMKRRFFVSVSTLGIAAALVIPGCSTPQTRISEHPDFFQSLSRRDQTLVTQGQISPGMSRNAVWLAWGSPDRKVVGNMRGRPTETWLYIYYATYPYYSACGPCDPWAFFGDPFYDPFYYSYVPLSTPYPGKIVTFSNGRVASFQYVASQ